MEKWARHTHTQSFLFRPFSSDHLQCAFTWCADDVRRLPAKTKNKIILNRKVLHMLSIGLIFGRAQENSLHFGYHTDHMRRFGLTPMNIFIWKFWTIRWTFQYKNDIYLHCLEFWIDAALFLLSLSFFLCLAHYLLRLLYFVSRKNSLTLSKRSAT